MTDQTPMHMLSRGQSAIEMLVTLLCPFCHCPESEPVRSTASRYCFSPIKASIPPLALGSSQTSSKPRHPALTFLRAKNLAETPAEELLVTLKTAKLGSVTDNLEGGGVS